jgi:hypothetical protein
MNAKGPDRACASPFLPPFFAAVTKSANSQHPGTFLSIDTFNSRLNCRTGLCGQKVVFKPNSRFFVAKNFLLASNFYKFDLNSYEFDLNSYEFDQNYYEFEPCRVRFTAPAPCPTQTVR